MTGGASLLVIRTRVALAAAMAALMLGALAPIAFGADTVFEKLTSRWLRPDGGYVLDIRAVKPGGAINAVYLNPRLINISKAQATRDGSTTRVFVELRAPNYPGSTYTLTYDPKRDELRRVYYQALQGQDVVFVRTQ